MGVTAYHDGQHQRAKEWFDRVVARQGQLLPDDHPLVVDSLLYLGYLDIEFGNWDAALTRVDRALTILSTGVSQDLLAEAHGIAAMAHGALGDSAAALAAIDRAIATQPEARPKAQLAIQRALFLVELGRAEEAIAVFESELPTLESQAASPEELAALTEVWIVWLQLLREQKNPDRAAGEFERIRHHHDIQLADLERLERAASLRANSAALNLSAQESSR
ncbi:MAG TPA: tetratricopeptide repeat protein [Enhygromyxa sp.]|nr:tetratricopeptide repeat protein [Enhygromyxa sp.]